ncbi:MAG: hypothetical protein FJ290_19980 [Planctomycetes bacterium]|nr:hypothetical protein [Planctomycetota bacterium]
MAALGIAVVVGCVAALTGKLPGLGYVAFLVAVAAALTILINTMKFHWSQYLVVGFAVALLFFVICYTGLSSQGGRPRQRRPGGVGSSLETISKPALQDLGGGVKSSNINYPQQGGSGSSRGSWLLTPCQPGV